MMITPNKVSLIISTGLDFTEQKIIPAMNQVRAISDELEQIVDDALWPLPKFREMLYIY